MDEIELYKNKYFKSCMDIAQIREMTNKQTLKGKPIDADSFFLNANGNIFVINDIILDYILEGMVNYHEMVYQNTSASARFYKYDKHFIGD